MKYVANTCLLDGKHQLVYSVVDGGWSSWVCGSCSKTCGGGTQNCTRSCSSPKPERGGRNCSGLSVAQNTCNIQCCPGKLMAVHLKGVCVCACACVRARACVCVCVCVT